MELRDNQMRLTNVEVLWPRLDRPYKKNNATGQWDPTELTDSEGTYDVILKLQPDQAEELGKKMSAMFKANFADKHWLQKIRDPETGGDSDVPVKKWQDLFKETDDGRFQRKFQIKTYGTPTTKPEIFDKYFDPIGVEEREPDFQMTTGSMVHAVISIKAWTFGSKCGISTRPDAFMVLTRAERKPPSDGQVKQNFFGDLAQPKEQSDGQKMFGGVQAPTTPEPMARTTVEAASPFPEAKKKEDIAVHPSLDGGIADEIPF
tara:strand:- start:1812 stop:2594 length:783 start_codon:yes stop_codon:yes gene_type:complete